MCCVVLESFVAEILTKEWKGEDVEVKESRRQ